MNRIVARKALSNYLAEPMAKLMSRLGFSPNVVTLLGLVVAGGSASLISVGHMWVGGGLLLLSGVFDLCDGVLARTTNRVTSFGALLDSVIDRVSELIVLLGLLVFYLHEGSTMGAVLVYLAVAGSIMVSYIRARAEGLKIECVEGIMTRPERVITLGIGLVIGEWWPITVLIVLGAIAGLTFLTSIQRLIHTKNKLES